MKDYTNTIKIKNHNKITKMKNYKIKLFKNNQNHQNVKQSKKY